MNIVMHLNRSSALSEAITAMENCPTCRTGSWRGISNVIDDDISMNEELLEAICVVEKIAPRNQSNNVRAKLKTKGTHPLSQARNKQLKQ
jgi:hypothetical protein